MSEEESWRAKVECTEVLHRFYAGLDGGRPDDVANLMAPDGVWLRQGAHLKGPDAVRSALEERSPSIVSAHLVCNAVVDLQGSDEALLSAWILVFRSTSADGGPPAAAPHVVMQCRDRMVRTTQGWRFAHKRATVAFRATH